MTRRYRVTFTYREPTYEMRHGDVARLYRGSFIISTSCPEGAEVLASRKFARWEMLSGVGWRREIVQVEVQLVVDSSAAGAIWD